MSDNSCTLRSWANDREKSCTKNTFSTHYTKWSPKWSCHHQGIWHNWPKTILPGRLVLVFGTKQCHVPVKNNQDIILVYSHHILIVLQAIWTWQEYDSSLSNLKKVMMNNIKAITKNIVYAWSFQNVSPPLMCESCIVCHYTLEICFIPSGYQLFNATLATAVFLSSPGQQLNWVPVNRY